MAVRERRRFARVPRWTIVSLIALGAIGVGTAWALRTTTDAPAAAADEFLGALVDERTDDAYAQLCLADREARTEAEFAHAVSDLIRDLESHDAFTLDPAGETRTVHYTLEYGTRTDQFDLDVTRTDDGTWHVCNFLDP
jgi:hypothetical protein